MALTSAMLAGLRREWQDKVRRWRHDIVEQYPAVASWRPFHCMPFYYGVFVVPGQSFWPSGHEDEHHDEEGVARFGLTVAPSNEDMRIWASDMIKCYKFGFRIDGGHSPVRSVVCLWGQDVEKVFYKASPDTQTMPWCYLQHQFDLAVNADVLTAEAVRAGYNLMEERELAFLALAEELVQREANMMSAQEAEKMRACLRSWSEKELSDLEQMRIMAVRLHRSIEETTL